MAEERVRVRYKHRDFRTEYRKSIAERLAAKGEVQILGPVKVQEEEGPPQPQEAETSSTSTGSARGRGGRKSSGE